jgi:hypothetical protein
MAFQKRGPSWLGEQASPSLSIMLSGLPTCGLQPERGRHLGHSTIRNVKWLLSWANSAQRPVVSDLRVVGERIKPWGLAANHGVAVRRYNF